MLLSGRGRDRPFGSFLLFGFTGKLLAIVRLVQVKSGLLSIWKSNMQRIDLRRYVCLAILLIHGSPAHVFGAIGYQEAVSVYTHHIYDQPGYMLDCHHMIQGDSMYI